jgi:hypothetical protein
MKLYFYILIVLLSLSCVTGDDIDNPKVICTDTINVDKTVQEIFNVATSAVTKYTDDNYIAAYITSSDQGGNFFKTISMQTLDGSLGLSVPIDQTDLYTIYNPGRKVYIKLQNSYIEIDNDALEIGELFIGNFLNESVGRIANPAFEEVVLKSCEVVDENSLVNSISIDNVSDIYLNSLVEFTDVQFTEEALNGNFYDSNKDDFNATNHFIEDATGAKLAFRTSSFANFAQTKVPNGNGTIRGVLTKFDGEYQLLARTINDIQLNNERLNIVIILKNNLFFTELADPNNNAAARFIEIYNGDDEAINLNGWTIRRYTNANETVSSTIELSGSTINRGQAFVIGVNAAEFEIVFGFVPDLVAGSNSPADSNGDDNLELVDSEGNTVDVFGIIGEDGTGTNHEFEDGRAIRNTFVVQGNAVYTFSEWQIWNDTGDAGTTNLPQDVPGTFTPGIR